MQQYNHMTESGSDAQSYAPRARNKSGQFMQILMFLILILAIAGVGVLGFLYYDSTKEIKDLKKNVDVSVVEYNEILEKIKSFVTISSKEKVNIAKIDNIEELKEQDEEFYADVVNGQYLIVMPTTQRVLVYDKDANKIVNFSSYTIQVELIPEEEIAASEKPLNIEIRFVSSVTDEVLNNVKTALTNASVNYTITTSTTASNDDYKGISLVLLNKTAKPKMSQNLIAHTGTNKILEELPEGEANSSADAVIIIGEVKQ